MTTLAEKYRPQSMEEVAGADLILTMLSNMYARDEVPSCMLFQGERGVGKTTVARLFSKMLNDGHVGQSTYIEIDAASHNGIEDIRQLQEIIGYAHTGKWRILVLDEVHSLSTAAFNALLKVLESPPERTVFILVTTSPEQVPETVRSRAMPFRFNPVGPKDVLTRVYHVAEEEEMDLDGEVLLRIVETCEGSLRDALVTLHQLQFLDRDPTVEDVNQITGNTINFTELMYAFIGGAMDNFSEEVQNIFAQSLNVQDLIEGLFSSFKSFYDSGMIDKIQFLSGAKIVWNMRKIRTSESVARTQMESALYALFADVFYDPSKNGSEDRVSKVTPEDVKSIQE